MFEARRHDAQGAAQFAVLPERRRHEIVALVHDQQIPRQVRRSLRRAAGRQKLLADIGLAKIVVRGDDPVERPPRIRVHAELASCKVRPMAIHHFEPQRELLPQLVTPLPAERSRGEHQDAPDPPPDQQLGQNQTGFDGLAEPHVVGEQQVDARHAKRLQ